MTVFDEGHKYINGKRMFYAYHEAFPCDISLRNISPEKTIKWVESTLKDQIVYKHYRNSFVQKKQKPRLINVIYVLNNNVILDIEDNGTITILFSIDAEKEANELHKKIEKFRYRNSMTRHIHLVAEGHFGLDLLPILNKKPKLSISLNYNDDLPEVHKHILKCLNKKNLSGLVLFHGIPGTGKSTYIRYLINYTKKKVIFIPPKLATNFDSPNMTSLMVDNSNSIFVIEDAEELIKTREGAGGSNISMLLNLTDGMLGQSLGIQVICTFNTKMKNIDSALLRKGRLIASYEFKELHAHKSNILLANLGMKNYPSDGELTLADIYNANDNQSPINSKNQIGFKRGVH